MSAIEDEIPARPNYGALMDAEDAAAGVASPDITAAPKASSARPNYGALMDAEDADQRRRAGAVQGVASQYNPALYAEATKLASEFGIDAKTVADNIEPYRKESKRRATESKLTDAPATREWLSNLDNAAVAQDDIETLTALERAMAVARAGGAGPLALPLAGIYAAAAALPGGARQRITDTSRAYAAGAVQMAGMTLSGAGRLYGALDRFEQAGPSPELARASPATAALLYSVQQANRAKHYLFDDLVDPEATLLDVGGAVKGFGKDIGPPIERQNLFTETVGALGQITAQIALASASGGLSLLALLGQGADIQGDRATAAGASQEQLDRAVAWGALVTAITEKYQLDRLLKFVPNGVRLTIMERLRRGLSAGLGEAAQEIIEGRGHALTAKLIYEPDAQIFNLDEMTREGIVAGNAGAMAKFVLDALVPGRTRADARADREMNARLADLARLETQARALMSGQDVGKISAELVSLAQSTQLAQDSPEKLESLIAAIKAKGGIETAYIDAAAFRTLYQSDQQANAAADALTGGRNTYSEAVITTERIAVPIEKYLAQLAPQLAAAKVEGKAFTDFVNFEADGRNANEAGAAMDALLAEARKAAEREVAEGTADTSQTIYDETLAQLEAAGYEKRSAQFMALLNRATIRTLATRAGMDPLELFRLRGSGKVRAKFESEPASSGIELTQEALETPEFKQFFDGSKVVDEAGQPLRVYHGTGKDFGEVFRTDPREGSFDEDSIGAWFAAEPRLSNRIIEHYAERNESPNVVPAFLSIRNPLVIQSRRWFKSVLLTRGAENGSSEANARLQALMRDDPVQATKQIKAQLIAQGYDGIKILDDNNLGAAWIAFNPSQIKSATGNRGTFDPASDNVLYQDDADGPIWVSALTRAAQNAKVKNDKASPTEWKNILAKAPGVKKEEREFIGIDGWLDEQGKSVTREAVVNYLRANQLVIEEKEIGPAVEPEGMDDEMRRDLSRRIYRSHEYLQDYLDDDSDTVRYYEVNNDPTVDEDNFDYEITIEEEVEEEDGGTADLFTSEPRRRVIESTYDINVDVREASIVSAYNGYVRSRVTFPDGRYVDALARFTVDEDDGALGDLEPVRDRWQVGEGHEFVEAELDAVAQAIESIKLTPNRELSDEVQSDIRSYDRAMRRASDHLDDGDVDAARSELQDAADTERTYDEEGPANQLLEELDEAGTSTSTSEGTKHDTYTTPGGESYTEFKLYLPPDKGAMAREHPRVRQAREELDALQLRLEEVSEEGIALRQQYPVISERPPEAQERVEALREEEAAILAQKDAIRRKRGSTSRRDYVSPPAHWDRKDLNIVAFVRLNTRTDKDGKRVLFLEEIQSDWHQAGRDMGYDSEPDLTPAPVTELPEGWSWRMDGMTIVLVNNGEWQASRTAPPWVSGLSQESNERALAVRAVEMYNDIAHKAARDEMSRRVPDAPLKTTWREMAFKRMIRYAADNGYDRIAWAPGKVVSERYSLDKFVDEIRVIREASGKFTYTATRDGETSPTAHETVKPEALAGHIGKELAAKAAKLEAGQVEIFRGEKLRVDNTDLVHQYDVLLKGEVAKLVKRLAEGKISEIYFTPTSDEVDSSDVATTAVALGTYPVQSIDMTPKLIEAARGGMEMFQRGAPTIEGDTSGKRGSITWGPDRKFTINLFEKRDLSTYLHESGHLYLEILGDLAESAGAPQQIKDDYAALLKWFGVKDRAGIGREQHEQFARGFEAYLAEGKAPSVELRPAFFRFRLWLLEVYKAIRQLGSTPGSIGHALNVSLTDEVRAVMDRMLATDEQIEEAQQLQQYAPIFLNAEEAGMSQTEWSAYRESVDKAHREQVEELAGRAMKELTREKQKWWKAERAKLLAEVTAEVNATPEYRAIAFLTKGKNPDGSALEPGVPTFKLARADIDARFGPDAYKQFPRGSTTTGPNGISAETAAQMLGFPSGADLVRALTGAPPKKQFIEQLTDKLMRERHGDMMLDGSLVEQAIDSVHTDSRAKVLAAELKALRRKRAEVRDFVRGATAAQNEARRQAREANEAALPARDELRVIREAAQLAIANKKIRTISPHLYRAAERKAARRAFEMAGKGKFEEAYLAKRQQILNFELYRAASAARATVDKHVEYMRRFDKQSVRKTLARAKGQYLAQIDALRERFDFTPQPRNADLKREALTKWVDEQRAAGREVTIPQWVIDEARRTPYQELTPGELDGLVDAAKNIEHLAKTKDRLLANRAEANFQQAKAQLEARAKASLAGGRAPPVSRFEEGQFKRFGRWAHDTADSWLRPETIVEWLDGGESGPWHDFLMEPANRAEYSRESLRTKILEPMRALANDIDKARRAELHESIHIDSLGQSFNRRTLVSIALNMGNASNMERLLKGGFRDITNQNRIGKFTPQSLIEIKDKLNANDWQFIQQAWDTAESLWPELKAFQERMGGLVPEKIPATPIVTRFGTFTGGYWPVVYDALASKAGSAQADSADALGILMGANFSSASTNKSALQSRTGAGGPLKLDFSQVMGRHLDQVITDITHREYAMQAMRILDDKDLKLTLQNAVGEVGWHSLRGMVGSAIQQDGGLGDLATNGMDTMRRRLISNLAVAALGLKVTTAFGNLVLAPIQAGARVNPTYILKGLASFMRHPKDSRAFVDEHSEMMRNRAQNLDTSFTVIREQIEGEVGIWAKTQRAAMAIHRAADYMGTTGIWLGRYRQALDAGSTHEESVRLADKAIRQTQTAGAPKDLSAFERNPAYRELKLFIGPMIIMQNRMREARSRKGVVKNWPEAFGTLLAAWFLPAILWDIVNGRGPDDDDDDDEVLTDEFLPWALRKLVVYPLATIPYVRDAVAYAERKYTGKYAEARMQPASDAVLLAIKAGATAIEQAGADDADDEDDARKVFKGALQAAGPLVGIPSNQIDITSSIIWDVWSGEYEPEGPADLRYLLMRRPKDE